MPRALLVEMTELVAQVEQQTGVDPRRSDYVFILNEEQAAIFDSAIKAKLARRIVRPTGDWLPPDGIRGRVLGWLWGIAVIARSDAPPEPCLVHLEQLRRSDAAEAS